MNSQPEKSNLHIPINWTLRAFGISLSSEEGVKWLRKKYPANTLEMKKLSQQAKSHICTEIWARLVGKSIVQCTILPNYVCICCVVHSCWETCSGLWSRPFDFWGGCGGWFQKKKYPGDWLQEKTILAFLDMLHCLSMDLIDMDPKYLWFVEKTWAQGIGKNWPESRILKKKRTLPG